MQDIVNFTFFGTGYFCITINILELFSFFFIYFYNSYVPTTLGSFLPAAPTPSITTHSAHSLSSPPPQYPEETILPLSLILLKREYKQ
jgi:hypothetical protein